MNEMETAVCKMPISEPAVFETLASEPARYELLVFEPTKEKLRKSEQRRQKRLRARLSLAANGVEQQSAMEKAAVANGVKQSTMEKADVTEVAATMVMNLLNEVNAAVTALEVTMENGMLEGQVKQPAMDAVTDQYGEQLNNWKLQTRSDGKQAIMEIMDAMSGVGKDTQQPVVDAVEKCGMVKQPFVDAVIKKSNSWDTKRKNVQKARKRQMK